MPTDNTHIAMAKTIEVLFRMRPSEMCIFAAPSNTFLSFSVTGHIKAFRNKNTQINRPNPSYNQPKKHSTPQFDSPVGSLMCQQSNIFNEKTMYFVG